MLTLPEFTVAQSRISGQLSDTKKNPLPYASVSIENTTDGITTDSLGRFSFKTREHGKQVLIATYIGYEIRKVLFILIKAV